MQNSDIDIHPLRFEDISTAVDIHQSAFSGFFLTFLGPRFLELLYRFYLEGETELALCAKCRGKIVGALLGTIDAKGFYSRLVKQHVLLFAWTSLKPMIKNPAILRRLFRALFYRGDSHFLEDGGALLASICVDPAYQRRNVGRALVLAFEDKISGMGAKFGYLTTDAENNKLVNNFYQELGWSVESEFKTKEGRAMRRYRKKVGFIEGAAMDKALKNG